MAETPIDSHKRSHGIQLKKLMRDAIETGDLVQAERLMNEGACLAHHSKEDASPIFTALFALEHEFINKILQRITLEEVESFGDLYYTLIICGCSDQFQVLYKRFPPSRKTTVDIAHNLIIEDKLKELEHYAEIGTFINFNDEDWKELKSGLSDKGIRQAINTAQSLTYEAIKNISLVDENERQQNIKNMRRKISRPKLK